MEENINIINELLSLYKIIQKEISKDKVLLNENQNNNEENINPILIINKIKDSISILLNCNKNDNSELRIHYNQLENQIIKLERDNKYYLRNFMRYKILKDALEMKLEAYVGLEEEYEELKEKVKYEGGKFLENDRKDNEINILRRENSTLKKEIEKLENKIKKKEKEKSEYIYKIQELNITIDSLNKKNSQLEKSLKEHTIRRNNIIKSLQTNNSCSNLGSLNNENSLIKLDDNTINNANYNYSIKNLKNIYNFNHNKKMLNFYSPKFDINPIEHHKNQNPNNNKTISTINSNIFNSTFSRIINGLNNKKTKIPIKNEYTLLKQPKNYSLSVIKGEGDESKSILVNKNEKYPNLNKNKTRIVDKILNSKPQILYPLTVKNKGHSIPKYLQRDYHQNIINNYSSQNL